MKRNLSEIDNVDEDKGARFARIIRDSNSRNHDKTDELMDCVGYVQEHDMNQIDFIGKNGWFYIYANPPASDVIVELIEVMTSKTIFDTVHGDSSSGVSVRYDVNNTPITELVKRQDFDLDTLIDFCRKMGVQEVEFISRDENNGGDNGGGNDADNERIKVNRLIGIQNQVRNDFIFGYVFMNKVRTEKDVAKVLSLIDFHELDRSRDRFIKEFVVERLFECARPSSPNRCDSQTLKLWAPYINMKLINQRNIMSTFIQYSDNNISLSTFTSFMCIVSVLAEHNPDFFHGTTQSLQYPISNDLLKTLNGPTINLNIDYLSLTQFNNTALRFGSLSLKDTVFIRVVEKFGFKNVYAKAYKNFFYLRQPLRASQILADFLKKIVDEGDDVFTLKILAGVSMSKSTANKVFVGRPDLKFRAHHPEFSDLTLLPVISTQSQLYEKIFRRGEPTTYLEMRASMALSNYSIDVLIDAFIDHIDSGASIESIHIDSYESILCGIEIHELHPGHTSLVSHIMENSVDPLKYISVFTNWKFMHVVMNCIRSLDDVVRKEMLSAEIAKRRPHWK